MSTLTIRELVFQGYGPCSFVVKGGECLGLTGVSGAGKTLLLRAVADLDPHGGRLMLGELDCDRIPAPEWRRRIGMLPAESGWWHDRVGDHFDQEQVRREWFERLGFVPDVLHWQVSRLSTGEKQRLAIIRLLANRPEALLLDEPTANLDRENVARAEGLLLEFCRSNRAPVLWVSHDQEQLERVADRIMIMRPEGITLQRGEDG